MPESKSTIGLMWAPKVPPSFCGAKNGSEKLHNQTKDLIEKPSGELVDGLCLPPRDPRKLNKLLKRNAKDTAGRSWFDMPAPKITPEIKNDLEILKLRHVIDPKKHFKRSEISNTVPKYFQVGTVIEPASEFFSSRLTKKERKETLADELLHDDALKAYSFVKFMRPTGPVGTRSGKIKVVRHGNGPRIEGNDLTFMLFQKCTKRDTTCLPFVYLKHFTCLR